MAVERLSEAPAAGADAAPGLELARAALEVLRKEIREATSSMTAVPKPLKFLAPHWAALKALYSSPRFAAAGAAVSSASAAAWRSRPAVGAGWMA